MAPVDNPISAAWDLRISQADVDRLRAGFNAEDTNEKWLVTSETVLRTHIVGRPNRMAQAGPFPGVHVSPGLMVVRISQNSTGKEVFTLGVRPITGGSGERVTSSSAASGQGGGGIIEAITWNSRPQPTRAVSEHQAKIDITILCRSILRCDLEAQPDYNHDMLFKSLPDDDNSRGGGDEDGDENNRTGLSSHQNGDAHAAPSLPVNGHTGDSHTEV